MDSPGMDDYEEMDTEPQTENEAGSQHSRGYYEREADEEGSQHSHDYYEAEAEIQNEKEEMPELDIGRIKVRYDSLNRCSAHFIINNRHYFRLQLFPPGRSARHAAKNPETPPFDFSETNGEFKPANAQIVYEEQMFGKCIARSYHLHQAKDEVKVKTERLRHGVLCREVYTREIPTFLDEEKQHIQHLQCRTNLDGIGLFNVYYRHRPRNYCWLRRLVRDCREALAGTHKGH
ncbi:hypothetical protein HII31_11680 [Pseudocercospora fuligena]|uniref:Uncharacterized protein n=1 Tax=Pseudocercospora fuligena TaxID=685502 RepID=A0A8H6RBP0_9PEZI|nr:hypothetical protein HII31_11680 [Pseudocercospora fuligena]